MDWAFERFSLYDFFNLLFSGGSLLLGLNVLGYSPLSVLLDEIGLPDDGAITLLSVLLTCYVIGFVIQGLGSIVDRKMLPLQHEMTSSCLMEGSRVIVNREKLNIYRSKAMRLFERKGIAVSDGNISAEQNDYFFAYCSYVAQMDSRCKKVERMRALKGLASQWRVCFGLLALFGCIRYIVSHLNGALDPRIEWLPLLSLAFALLSVWSHFRMRENLLFWIRMVFAMYEVIDDERIQAGLGTGSCRGNDTGDFECPPCNPLYPANEGDG